MRRVGAYQSDADGERIVSVMEVGDRFYVIDHHGDRQLLVEAVQITTTGRPEARGRDNAEREADGIARAYLENAADHGEPRTREPFNDGIAALEAGALFTDQALAA